MIKSKLLSDLSINTVQVILNQFAGIIVFFIISKYLDKNSFGQMNWTMAVLMIIFTTLGCGLEQLTVKKTATGNDPGLLLTTYFFHVLITGLSFLGILFILQQISPAFQKDKQLFFLLAVSQCLSFFSLPFKQVVNGLEAFNIFFFMSTCANICKVLVLLLLFWLQKISLTGIIWVYVFASCIELLICIFMCKIYLHLPVSAHYNRKGHIALLRESLPQLGITIFNTAVARFDWVLLGLLSTTLVVAEYSFAYRLFELSTLPLLVLAPILFPRISRLFANDPADKQMPGNVSFSLFIRAEIMVAVFVALVMNICWKNIVDLLTGNKYGSSTAQLIFILSCCMPLLYLNNILWSINFAKGRMRVIFICIVITFLVNIAADIFLIPLFSATGAALGFVIATIVQTVFYYFTTTPGNTKILFIHLMLICASGLTAGLLSKKLLTNTLPQVILACAGYFFLLLFTGQLNIKDWAFLRKSTAV